jgi:hypothetical protein
MLLVVGIAVYALADLAGADAQQTGGIPKAVWAIIIIIAPVIGPLAWIIMRRRQRGHGNGPSRPRPAGPVAPDDDPDFLWKLDQESRRKPAKDDPPSGG